MDINTVVTSINAALGIGKGLLSVDKALDQAELKLRMVELVDKLFEAKDQILSIREENFELRESVRRLSEKLEQKGSTIYEGNKYWVKKDDGSKDGPFCQKCKDTDDKLIRLQKASVQGQSYWQCQTCKEIYDYPNIQYNRRGLSGLSNLI